MPARALFPPIALAAALVGSPAAAGDYWPAAHADQWYAVRQGIYDLENTISGLEAHPQVDDGYRAPIIRHARRDIWRLRAQIAPAQWRWPSPCCYSRKPIYIR